jgi:hypothetical protein
VLAIKEINLPAELFFNTAAALHREKVCWYRVIKRIFHKRRHNNDVLQTEINYYRSLLKIKIHIMSFKKKLTFIEEKNFIFV